MLLKKRKVYLRWLFHNVLTLALVIFLNVSFGSKVDIHIHLSLLPGIKRDA